MKKDIRNIADKVKDAPNANSNDGIHLAQGKAREHCFKPSTLSYDYFSKGTSYEDGLQPLTDDDTLNIFDWEGAEYAF
ncbi:MAG TPA: hypothetical protein VJI75_00285 [Candidatus Nanoarchaeia archaeon]|nr:hypothetical protein [Candidatus Nanoarchaeia archaeon]